MHFAQRERRSLVLLLFLLGSVNVFLLIGYSSWRHVQSTQIKHSDDVVVSEVGLLHENSHDRQVNHSATARTQTVHPTHALTANIMTPFSSKRMITPLRNDRIKCDSDPYVVTLIYTLPSNSDLRQAIRQTWGKLTGDQTRKLLVVFVTGDLYEATAEDRISLAWEIQTYGDVLRGKFRVDDRVQTSLPLLLGVEWALQTCKSFRYLYAGYDSTILNYKKMLERLDYCIEHDLMDSRTWMGMVTAIQLEGNSKSTYNSSPQSTRQVYQRLFCPDENGYVISRSLAKDLILRVKGRSLVPFKADMLLCTLAVENNWTLINDELFTELDIPADACAARNTVTLRAPEKAEALLTSWMNLTNKEVLRDCRDPDLVLVLPANVDNRAYLNTVLAYMSNPQHVCYDQDGKPLNIFMVVLVITPPSDDEVRKAIRETWCKKLKVQGETIRCVFVMGMSSDEPNNLKKNIQIESAKHGDIIEANFFESYQNITLKIILGLKWIAENCQHAQYFYKGDSDMFVNFNNIFSYIKSLRSRGEAMDNFYLGSRNIGSIRFSPNIPEHRIYSRYHVSDSLYSGRYYPPYCSGGGYVMSTEKVPELYKESLTTPIINIEDAFMGILAKKVGIYPTTHSGFMNWGGRTDTCALRNVTTMTVHGIGKSAQDLRMIWNRYNDERVNCSTLPFQ